MNLQNTLIFINYMNYLIKYIILFILGICIYKLLNHVDTLIFKVDDSIKEDLYRDKYTWIGIV